MRASEAVTINQVCKNDGSQPDVDVEYGNNCEFGAAAGVFTRPEGAPGEGARPAPPPTTESDSGGLGPIPIINPPYARLVAIDMNKGEIAWRVPFGEGSPAIRRHPLLKGVKLPDRLGTPGQNGAMVTRSGIVFIGGGDPYLYAFDKATGREIARVATQFPTSGNPMTYKTRGGPQYVVIATGAGPDSTLVAFRLRAK